MSLTRLALKFAAPAVKLEASRRYLFIGPHPDDIEIGAGATAVATKVSAVLDVLAAIGFAAKMRPSNFLVFKGFAFAGFFLYAHYSLGGATFTTAAAFSALLGLAAKIIL